MKNIQLTPAWSRISARYGKQFAIVHRIIINKNLKKTAFNGNINFVMDRERKAENMSKHMLPAETRDSGAKAAQITPSETSDKLRS